MNIYRSTLIALSMTGAFVRLVSAQATGGAVLVGRVYADTSMRPIPGVVITIAAISKSATADARGFFRLTEIPAGHHVVRARGIGLVPFEASIEFRDGQTVERGIVLPRLTTLDSVRVVGEVNVPLSFLENRARGFGHFILRDDLEKQGNRKLADVISQIPGLGVVQGRGGQGWILSKRAVPRLRRASSLGVGDDLYVPSGIEKSTGLVAGCYARVYLDGALLNSSTPADPINVNEFFTGGVEAIEFYSGPAQTPDRYSRLNSACGVLVIHTRR